MARVTYGGGVTAFAGSIGGVTFLDNASGHIAKLRSRPIVNPSPRQSPHQRNHAFLVAFWPTLSQANKDLWDAFAVAHDHTTPWGETKTLSGYQWFLACNLSYIRYYAPPLSAPPAWNVYAPPASYTLAATVDHLRAEFDPALTFAGHLVWYLTLPLRQSSLKLRRSHFWVGLFANQSGVANFDLTAWFEALANVTWLNFFNSADCSIISHCKYGYYSSGLFSAYTSEIVKID